MLGSTTLFAGVQNQDGYSFDADIPILGRTLSAEWVVQRHSSGGVATVGNPRAYNITLDLLKSKSLTLNAAYGKAQGGFEYFTASSANPYARTWGEAVFDRSLALGAPLINGNGAAAGGAGAGPRYMAAKQSLDISGSVRIPLPLLKKQALDFRWYNAKGTGGVDLGDVWSIGSKLAVTPGVDVRWLYGVYNVPGPTLAIPYGRITANIGF